ELMGVMPGAVRRQFLKRQLKRGLFDRSRLTPALLNEYTGRLLTREGRHDFLRLIRASDPPAVERAMRASAEQRTHRLILWAQNDRYQPPAEGQRLFDLFNAAKLVNLAGAGHFLQEDQPERIVTEIRKYLQGLPPLD